MPQRHAGLRIGIDLDNTLIDYDRLFCEISLKRGLVPVGFTGTKRDVRDHVRRSSGGDIEWQRLQAHVYGPAIAGATAAEGALDFIRRVRERGAELTIVSHKTESAQTESGTVDLRSAARAWLRTNGFLGPGAVPEANLYFEDTRAAKIARIVALRCTHFIDDLEEVFDDPAFPHNVHRLLLAGATVAAGIPYPRFASFSEISDVLVAD